VNYGGEKIKDPVGELMFLGIHPDIVGFNYPMTPPWKEALDVVNSRLAGWVGDGVFNPHTPALSPEGRG
ncbi:hydrogenase maturation peptidase HycI, partial [Enterobacter intestinihominis]